MATRRQASAPAYKEQVLLEQALEALRQGTGLIGQVAALSPSVESGVRADAAVELNADGQRHAYLVQVRSIDRFAALGQVRNQFDSFPRPGLLVAPRITPEIADQCRRLGVQFVDIRGNAYLHGPGLLVWVKGQRPRSGGDKAVAAMETARGGTAAALRVVFALLCRPQSLNASHREINQAAGVALGAVGGVLSDLGRRGYILGAKAGMGRRWLERQRLIDEWVVQYPVILRPKLNPRRFHGPGMDWRQMGVARYGMQWGGEVAADRLTSPAALTALEWVGHDIELGGAWLLGHDVATIAGRDTRDELRARLADARLVDRLAADMARATRGRDDAFGAAGNLLAQFSKGFAARGDEPGDGPAVFLG